MTRTRLSSYYTINNWIMLFEFVLMPMVAPFILQWLPKSHWIYGPLILWPVAAWAIVVRRAHKHVGEEADALWILFLVHGLLPALYLAFALSSDVFN